MVLQKRIWAKGSLLGMFLLAFTVMDGCDRGGGSPGPESNATAPAVVPDAVAKAKANNTPVDPAIVAADNGFGLSVLQALQSQSSSTNIAISPLSLSLALQVVYNGAGGTTQQAMVQTLQLGSLTTQQVNDANAALQASLMDADPGVQLQIGNSLWVHSGDTTIVPSFTAMDQNYYGAMIGDLAGAPDDVNAWVANETDGLITKVLPPGDYSHTTAIVANAVYFKGQWATAFDPNSTSAAPFTLNDGTSITVPTMHQSGQFAYLQGPDFQMLRLPYGQGRMSMVILLPESGTSLGALVSTLTADQLKGWIEQLHDWQISVALPKFTAQVSNDMSGTLQALGMAVAFRCPGAVLQGDVADFSSLTSAPVCIQNVWHDTWIEVDETGTVAAGGTAVPIGTTVVGPGMTVNHPFLYAIRDDETGTLLFVGVLMDPSK
jgi:serine protease inhibitor